MEYYSAVKKNEAMPFAATWMDLVIIMLDEVSQIDKGEISYDVTYTWNLKIKWYKWTYFQNESRLIDLENKFMITKGERFRGERK